MKRLLLLCGIVAMLLFTSYRAAPVKAEPAKATSRLTQTETVRIAKSIVKIVIERETKRRGMRVRYTCGAVCEDRMEQAVIRCLQNGGDVEWCFTAAEALYCQCAWVECGQRGNGCSVILP